MSRRMKLKNLVIGSIIITGMFATLRGSAEPTENPDERVLRSHVGMLNELSDRRRLNTFFPNEQSAFYGVPIRYVNSSRGNLSFVRRDLVTAGRIPIVLARVYDSSRRAGGDFGPGWRLSLAETIDVSDDGNLIYVDDSASELRLVPNGAGDYTIDPPGLTDIATVEALESAMRLIYRSGWTKFFVRIGDRFHLTEIRDTHDNAITLHYSDSLIDRIEGQNGRFVSIGRDQSGRIARVADDQGRTVSYAYDSRSQLEVVTDLGGHPWRYEYDSRNRLDRVADPQGREALSVVYDAGNRVKTVRILGSRYRYKYKDGDTLIKNEANQETRISHDRSGVATSVTSPDDFISEVLLDGRHRVTTLSRNETARAAFSYDSLGRIATVTRFDGTGAVDLVYAYDSAGRPIQITGSDGSSLTLEYSAAGDLLRRTGNFGDQSIGVQFPRR